MKKLILILILALALTGCGHSRTSAGQVLELWEDQVVLGLDGGGRLYLSLPEAMAEPQIGDYLRITYREDRLISWEVLIAPPPIPTELNPGVPQLNP